MDAEISKASSHPLIADKTQAPHRNERRVRLSVRIAYLVTRKCVDCQHRSRLDAMKVPSHMVHGESCYNRALRCRGRGIEKSKERVCSSDQARRQDNVTELIVLR